MSNYEEMTPTEHEIYIALHRKRDRIYKNKKRGAPCEVWTAQDESVYRPLFRKYQRIKKRRYRDNLRQIPYVPKRRLT